MKSLHFLFNQADFLFLNRSEFNSLVFFFTFLFKIGKYEDF